MQTYITATREIGFDAGHRVPRHGGKCQHPHGHRYKLEVDFVLPDGGVHKHAKEDEGMVMDFGVLKEVMLSTVHDAVDHGFMLDERDDAMIDAFQYLATHGVRVKVHLIPGPPTAEVLVRYFAELIQRELHVRNSPARVKAARLWETPNCRAEIVYSIED